MRAALLAVLFATPVAAQVAGDCDRPAANARNLARPYHQAIRDFANGAITLIDLVEDEPACCGSHLMVLLPDPEASASRICALVTTEDGQGWFDVDLGAAEAVYDPSTGLTVHVPIHTSDAPGTARPGLLAVTIDQQTGVVSPRLEGS